jgi:hypothetical protein
MNRETRWALVLTTFAAACWGVNDYSHDVPPPNSSNDFGSPTGPAPTSTATTPPTSQPDAASSTGAGGAPSTGAGGHEITAAGGASGAGAPGTGGAPAPVDAAVVSPPAEAAAPLTITLGGTVVTKENAIAFIHLGHSNMAGRATGPAADIPYFQRDADPHAWMYHVGMSPQPALEPGTAGDNAGNQFAGPGTALLKQAAAMAPGKYFISLGFGQGAAYCSQFLPGALYYDSLIAAPKAIKGRVTFAAIVIMLGITERHGTAADITGYPNCINQLVTSIRTDVGEPNLPLLITDYEMNATGDLAPTGAFAQQITPQIRMVPTVVSNSVLVPTDGMQGQMQDDHHFNMDGHKTWTGRVLQIMKQKGWFPWGP